MYHQVRIIGNLRHRYAVHRDSIATKILETVGELGSDPYYVESPVEIPVFRKIYLVHRGHREGFSIRIIRSEIEVVYRIGKVGHVFCITVEEIGQRPVYTDCAFYSRHTLFVGKKEYLLRFVGCNLE